MAKKRATVDDRQLSLLDLLKKSEEIKSDPTTEGSLNIQTRLCHSLSNAVRSSGLSRFEIAGKLSHLLGTEISKYQIDAWTSESKSGHRIPASYLPAFCRVTGCREPLEILTETGGLFCMPGPEALRAEIQRYTELERKARSEKRKREMFLNEMEGRTP